MSSDQENSKYEIFSKKKMLGFTFGALILNVMWNVRGKIQIFATKALGLSLPIVLGIITIFVVWDAVNDPVTGYLLDRSSKLTSKRGKRYPFILIGMIGSSIALIFLFLPVSYDPFIAAFWILLILGIWDAFQTIFELSYQGLTVDIFRDQKQRVFYGSISLYTAGIGSLLAGFLLPILLAMFGGVDIAESYFATSIIVVIIMTLFAIPYCYCIREPDEMVELRIKLNEEGKSTSPLKEILGKALRDRNWIGVIIGYMVYVISIGCLTVGIDFFVVDTLGVSIANSAFVVIMYLIGGFCSVPIWIKIVKKSGGRKAWFFSFMYMTITSIIFLFSTNITLTIIFAFIAGAGNGGQGVIFNTVYSEAIDNATIESGKREESSYLGILRFFSALGMFWQILFFTIIAAITGYVPTLGTANTEIAKFGLLVQISIVPAILTLVGGILFYSLNTITKEKAIVNKKKIIELGL